MMLLEQQSEKEGAEQIDFEGVRPSDSSVQPTHSLTPRVGRTSHDPGSLAPSDAGRHRQLLGLFLNLASSSFSAIIAHRGPALGDRMIVFSAAE